MISVHNKPTIQETADVDFTEDHYRQLLRAARLAYAFATYDAIPWNSRFVLWRHDIDFSIVRAARLAKIEREEGVTATYFVNPRSEFYNPLEPSQARLVEGILKHGHRLGLHLDAAFQSIESDVQLHERVTMERAWLEQAFGVSADAFSFHNPAATHMKYEAEAYGGLINTYSQRLKAEVPYCSDSNGYWRFQRLHDVLTEASNPCLQVLTHPGWWQKRAMPPRQRIFRSVYGRARVTMAMYDGVFASAHSEQQGRINQAGPSAALGFLRRADAQQFELCDYLWNRGHFQTLFLELWRWHELQKGQTPYSDRQGQDVRHARWLFLREEVAAARSTASIHELEQGCLYLCAIIQELPAVARG